MLLDAQAVEAGLQDLEVGDELVVQARLPVDLGDRDLARVDDVHDLAVDVAGAEGLDSGHVDLRGGGSTCSSWLTQPRISPRGTK